MNLIRIMVISVGILLGTAVLFVIGGLGEVEVLFADECTGHGYLCEPQQTVAEHNPTNRMGAEHRFGLR